jgi:two-component system, cell cycle response regulator
MEILIADDDRCALGLLREMLQYFGHDVVAAHDGNEAWQLLERPNAPDLVVLDGMMPGMDGVTLCGKLRSLPRSISPYIILVTGMTDQKDFMAALAAGADDYITKPFNPDELFMRIRAGERIVKLQYESLAARDALKKRADYDLLTGLLKQAAILDVLQREFDESSRSGRPVTIMMAGIDRLGEINDLHGREAGDKVLAETAKRMALEVHSYETIGRYGGNDFLVVLSECDLTAAGIVAERVQHAIAAQEYDVAGGKMSLTMSVGLASSSELTFPTQKMLIALAYAARCDAKLPGHDRADAATGRQDPTCCPR